MSFPPHKFALPMFCLKRWSYSPSVSPSPNQEIPPLVRNPKVHYHTQYKSPEEIILSIAVVVCTQVKKPRLIQEWCGLYSVIFVDFVKTSPTGSKSYKVADTGIWMYHTAICVGHAVSWFTQYGNCQCTDGVSKMGRWDKFLILFPNVTFLGTFAYLRKASISFVMSVHLFVGMYQLVSHRTDICEISYWRRSLKSAETIQIYLALYVKT